MAKEEPPSVSRDLQELQRKLGLLLESFQNNSKESTSESGIFLLELLLCLSVTFISMLTVAARASAFMVTIRVIGRQVSRKEACFQGNSKLRKSPGTPRESQTASYIPCNAEFGWIVTPCRNCHSLAGSKKPCIVYTADITLFSEAFDSFVPLSKEASQCLVHDLSCVFHLKPVIQQQGCLSHMCTNSFQYPILTTKKQWFSF
ncbi:promethin isoform X1 [Mastomys coucha]|uniref:promethin isoform X1 n=1 Tax=Mastomys coucha TaxID=35658 RepID=UPI0012622318|nr:promethin isoform X1 [Mastomys coucha]XP_031243965.1 promethin isoform X1 [Mastomys coucha]XP_031243966.1 promethin isoform X1 [Mastomys coucha]